MKFNINQQDLQQALSYCQGVIEKRSTLPILSNVLLDASNLQLTITATDLDLIFIHKIKNIEVVEWNEGQSMDWHRDYPYYEGTSIIFLNDNYGGGELVTASDPSDAMEHTRIIHSPEKGAIVSFLNTLYHKVNPVIKGKRYTLAVWYELL